MGGCRFKKSKFKSKKVKGLLRYEKLFLTFEF
jgi:hypothetical protein